MTTHAVLCSYVQWDLLYHTTKYPTLHTLELCNTFTENRYSLSRKDCNPQIRMYDVNAMLNLGHSMSIQSWSLPTIPEYYDNLIC